jgi:FHS family L-fucose permease-like MFS transporter
MSHGGSSGSSGSDGPLRRPGVVVLVLVVFFVISLFTNILGPLIPEIISAFHISLTAAGLLPFAVFAAYGLTSIPAGLWIERASEKRVMLASFVLALVAALSFAIFPRYGVAIGSLFAMGVAMAALQVALNPLLRVAGGEEHFAFFSTLAQLVFGAASFLSPRVYAFLVDVADASDRMAWVKIYWVLAACAVAMLVVIAIARLPRVERQDDERQTESLETHRDLFRRGIGWYFISIFMYVGSEQGVASWLSQFLATYHGVDPRSGGASAVSWFWGLMTLGCVVGLGLLKLFDSRKLIIVHAACAIVLLAIGLFGNARAATLALPAIGLVASVMWPIIFSLALNSVPAHHGTVSGILCTGVVGGAVVPLLVGRIGDKFGLRVGMALLFITFAWVLGVGIWAKPIVSNKSVLSSSSSSSSSSS